MDRLNKIPLFKVFMPKSVIPALEKTLFSGYIAEGKKVGEFGQLVSEYLGNPYVVLVNSCTTAITLAYHLSDIKAGDEVISTPLTCVASNQPILYFGAKPIWADVNPETGMSDPEDIEKLITEKTRAILILHKEGDPAQIDTIVNIAKNHNLRVIEDAAHALGAKYKNLRIGNHGDFVCFSLQAIKHITTGDGGILACKNESDYLRAKKLKWFGVDRDQRLNRDPWLEDIEEWGYKANMNDISATIGIEQFSFLDEIINKFNKNGMLYGQLLKNVAGITLLKRRAEDFSTFWAYCLLAEGRDRLIKKLETEGVEAKQIHPRNDLYSIFKDSKRYLPNMEAFSSRELCLPCGWWVDAVAITRICEIIKKGW